VPKVPKLKKVLAQYSIIPPFHHSKFVSLVILFDAQHSAISLQPVLQKLMANC